MSNKDFYTLWGAALNKTDRDIFVAEWATSTIWGEPDTLEDDDLIHIADYCGKLWDAAHMTIREIKETTHMTQAEFAERFCIPKRTVEDWCRGVAKCADHVRLMIMEALGIVSRSV